MTESLKIIKVSIYDELSTKTEAGEISVQTWDRKERTQRAIKLGGLCWVAALVAIIFPLIHFVLVPAFLIAGPVVALFILSQESVILGGKGICPSCRADLPIERTSNQFPFTDLCSHCHRTLKINLA